MSQRFIIPKKSNLALWFLLAFQGGAINAGAFMACGSFVTHTTGFATLFGVGFARGHFQEALAMLTVPIFFLAGSMVTARFVELPLSEGERANYEIPCLLIILLLLLTTCFGEIGVFGKFFLMYENRDYFLLALLSLASGIQNALASDGHGHMIRTTHMTGNTTDLAVGAVVQIFGKKGFHNDAKFFNFAKSGVIGAFILGSLLSAFLFKEIQYWGFLLPLVTAIASYRIFLKGSRVISHPQ